MDEIIEKQRRAELAEKGLPDPTDLAGQSIEEVDAIIEHSKVKGKTISATLDHFRAEGVIDDKTFEELRIHFGEQGQLEMVASAGPFDAPPEGESGSESVGGTVADVATFATAGAGSYMIAMRILPWLFMSHPVGWVVKIATGAGAIWTGTQAVQAKNKYFKDNGIVDTHEWYKDQTRTILDKEFRTATNYAKIRYFEEAFNIPGMEQEQENAILEVLEEEGILREGETFEQLIERTQGTDDDMRAHIESLGREGDEETLEYLRRAQDIQDGIRANFGNAGSEFQQHTEQPDVESSDVESTPDTVVETTEPVPEKKSSFELLTDYGRRGYTFWASRLDGKGYGLDKLDREIKIFENKKRQKARDQEWLAGMRLLFTERSS